MCIWNARIDRVQNWDKYMLFGTERNIQFCQYRYCGIPENRLKSNWNQQTMSKLVKCSLLRPWLTHPRKCFQLQCTLGMWRWPAMSSVWVHVAMHTCHSVNHQECFLVASRGFWFVWFGPGRRAKGSFQKLRRVSLQSNTIFIKSQKIVIPCTVITTLDYCIVGCIQLYSFPTHGSNHFQNNYMYIKIESRVTHITSTRGNRRSPPTWAHLARILQMNFLHHRILERRSP